MTVVVIADIAFRNGNHGRTDDRGVYLTVPASNRAVARTKAKKWAELTYGPSLIDFKITSTHTARSADPETASRIIPKKRTVRVQPMKARYLRDYQVTATWYPKQHGDDTKTQVVTVQAASGPRALERASADLETPDGYHEPTFTFRAL